MGWWITLGVLVLLGILPLGISVKYDADGPLVRLIAGPVKLKLYPRNAKKSKKKPQPAEDKPKNTKTASKESKQPSEKPFPEKKKEEPGKKGGSLTDFLPLVRILMDFLGDFKSKLRVEILELKLTLAADDPCDLAVNYGRAWAAVGNLMPRLEQFLVIKKRDIDVLCDFTADEMTVYARLDLTITLGRLLAAILVFAFRALAEFLKIMIKRKGGTENESESSQYAE